MAKTALRLLLILLIMLMAPSCMRSDDGIPSEEGEDIALPDVALEGAKYTLGQEGEGNIFMEAERMEIFQSEGRACLYGMSLCQKDGDGGNKISGRADKAEVKTKSKVCALSGNVMLREESEGCQIEGDDIVFDTSEGIITANGKVRVTFEDGTLVGENLSINLNSMTLELKVVEEGLLST